MYHIQDLKKFTKCPSLYLFERESEDVFRPYLRSDESYIDLLKQKLSISDCFIGNVGDKNDAFFENINNYEWFINARFEIKELRVKVPILHKNSDNTFDAYFIYFGTIVKDIDKFSYSITIEVLEKLGVIIRNIFVAHINKKYVFKNSIDPSDLFIIDNKFKGKGIIDIINDNFVDYESIINKIESSNLDNTKSIKTRVCHMPNMCAHYYECFKEEISLSDDSILTLVSSAKKNRMFNEGIKLLRDVDIERIEGNRIQYAQIMASRNGGLFVDKYGLKHFLDQLDQRPISFVDFEWDRYLIPPYEGMKPLDVMPFEFALYVDDGKELKHHTFLSSGDCRKEFIETLLECLPKEGKILAYNAAGAEVLRLKELQELYPEYEDKIKDVIDRFVDLAFPFQEGLIYDTRMRGNFTLKKLVDIVSDKSYSDLDVNNGMEAVYSWRDIDKGLDVDEDKIIDDLKEYCSLDAYGLKLVYDWLLKIVE